MWKVTVKGLLAHKLRLALTALAIVLGVTFISGTLVLDRHPAQHLHHPVRQRLPARRLRGPRQGRLHRRRPGNARRASPSPSPCSASSAGARGGRGRGLGRRLRPVRGPRRQGRHHRRRPDPRALLRPRPAAVLPPPGPRARHRPRPHDVVMDAGTATEVPLRRGDQRVRVLLAGPPQTFTLTGIVSFGTADNLAGATLAAFDLPTAQQLFDLRRASSTPSTCWPRPGPTRRRSSAPSPRSCRRGSRWSPARPWPTSRPAPSTRRSSFFSDRAAGLRLHLAVRRRVHHLQHVLDHRGPADPGAGPAAHRRAPADASCSARCCSRPFLVGLVASLVGLGLGVLAAVGLEALLQGLRRSPCPRARWSSRPARWSPRWWSASG